MLLGIFKLCLCQSSVYSHHSKCHQTVINDCCVVLLVCVGVKLLVGLFHCCGDFVSAITVDVCVNMVHDLFLGFLGRLLRVNLITYMGRKMSVRPSTKSFFNFNQIWYVGRGR